ncbi:MAG: ABC transporter ATP-binding protein [Ruminococcus sp.]|jgi:ABC-2 type transport system ATP-binding protein|nr:ABC transporter ATP-binding protein [Ruminococcus sp.]
MAILETVGLTKAYGKKKIALDDVSLNIESGKIIGLCGPNGSGKTTLIKLAAGLLTPTAGSITIDGMNIGPDTKAVVSYLPDKTFVPEYMKVFAIIDFFREFYADFDMNAAYEMLKRLDIDGSETFKTLSKGTQEKVQLVLIMSRKAKLYLLDEPIGGVDPAARDYILNTIISNYNADSSVIISTHLISDIENTLDEVIFIKYGKLFLHSTSDEIRETHGMSVDAYFREVFKC